MEAGAIPGAVWKGLEHGESDSATGGARNHHYVPQCYLRGFARNRSKKAQLFVVDLREGKAFPTRPRNVAAQRDYNRIEIPGKDPNLVEEGYAEFEAKLAPALVRLEEKGDFASDDDKSLVLELIAILVSRNPGFRESRRSGFAQMAKIIGSMLVSTEERYLSQMSAAQKAGFLKEPPLPYEEMRSFIEEERYTIEVSSTSHVAMELKLLEHVRELVHARTWTLMKAPAKGAGFVTSDHPVVLTWDKPEGKRLPPGFAHKDTSVFFPVSKGFTLFGRFGVDDHPPVELDEANISRVNTGTVMHALRQVYAESDRFLFMDATQTIRRGKDLLTFLQAPAGKH